ncbi:LysR family transcriptional regulator [Wenyingzhuangia aestuarii]|uniref:LysR family transcriptional regulator n=1 Tax=Wenyingzhuangia aestuarii TaxID=1647582 RepID=UPI00143B4F2E|nr:LysR family transcriptional regulator [Wenyingzhuangia aestuarii]NJB82363.1 DNA-binding transcriptional LysR family regulator [Wenyingzhuangia aestuarii]
MHYTLHQLVIYLKVIQKNSITKAAEELHLTQPAVSIQIKKLQEQFDIPLIEVIGRKIHVTEFGQEIAIACHEIVNQMADIKNKAMAYKGMVTGKIKISVVSTGKYVVPYFLTKFSKLFPSIEIIIDVTNKSKVIESLEKNKTDFALVSTIPENLNIERVPLMSNKLFLVRKHNTKAPILKFKTSDLNNIPLIYREEGSATRQAMEKYLTNNAIKNKKTIELVSNEAVKQAVIADMGYSIMPLIGMRNELLNDDLEILSLPNLPIETQWNLIWLKDKQLPPSGLAYLNFIQENKDNIIHNHFDWCRKF